MRVMLRDSLRRKVEEAGDKLMAQLGENGLRLDWQQIRLGHSLEHYLQNPDDPFMVSALGPAGFRIMYGTHIPARQNNPKCPDEVEIFCGLEEPISPSPPYANGFRLATKVETGGWYMRHWSVTEDGSDLGNIRRDILGQKNFRVPTTLVPPDKVPLIIARITELFLKGK